MQALINRILSNNLADFKGLEVKGTIPIKEEIVNTLVSSFIDEFFAEKPSPKSSANADPEYAKIIKKLKPSLFKISFEKGKAIIDLELKK